MIAQSLTKMCAIFGHMTTTLLHCNYLQLNQVKVKLMKVQLYTISNCYPFGNIVLLDME